MNPTTTIKAIPNGYDIGGKWKIVSLTVDSRTFMASVRLEHPTLDPVHTRLDLGKGMFLDFDNAAIDRDKVRAFVMSPYLHNKS